jgi:hypothetical protein
MINISKHARFTLCAFALLASPAFAQSGGAEQTSTPQQPAAPPVPTVNQENTPGTDTTVQTPRFSFGFRVEYFPERFFQTQYATVNTINPIQSAGYFAQSAGAKLGFGLTSEYRLNEHLTVGLDFFRHQEEYTQLAQIKSGVQDPNSSYDNRPVTSITQDTRSYYWDFPLVVRYYIFRVKAPRGLGWLAQTYALGGGTFRHVSDIRTGTATTFPDSSTSYNEIPVAPNHNNLVGAFGGVGYKLFEYGKFKAMGEGRFTRWFADTFQGPGYESRKNQLEVGLSFTY